MTSIEWLINWAKENPVAFQSDYYEAIEKAKEMHKEEMEISNEEIRKQAIKYDNGAFSETPIVHFMEGAKWYREQIKQKQDK
jgi:hypothetical protein